MIRERLVVDVSRLGIDVVLFDLVELPGEVDVMPVREMPAVIEIEREDPITGIEHREVHPHVRLRATAGLDVRVLRAEEVLRAGNGEFLDGIDVFTAAVVARSGIALGVLVRQDRALCLEDRRRDVVLRGDHVEGPLLALALVPNDGIDVPIRRRECASAWHGQGILPNRPKNFSKSIRHSGRPRLSIPRFLRVLVPYFIAPIADRANDVACVAGPARLDLEDEIGLADAEFRD